MNWRELPSCVVRLHQVLDWNGGKCIVDSALQISYMHGVALVSTQRILSCLLLGLYTFLVI